MTQVLDVLIEVVPKFFSVKGRSHFLIYTLVKGEIRFQILLSSNSKKIPEKADLFNQGTKNNGY